MTLGAAFRYFVTHPSPWLLLAICSSFWGTRAYLALTGQDPFNSVELYVAFGILIYWPFQEWWMHKWLLHFGTIKIFGKTFEPHFAKTHRFHHEEPENMKFTFLPAAHILSSLVVFTGVGYLVTSSIAHTAVFMGCASLSTLLYEWTHYLTHTRYKPRGKYYRRIWQLHRWHHYKHEGYWFSFTVPYLDGWFGTGPDPKEVERSPTARTLGGDPHEQL